MNTELNTDNKSKTIKILRRNNKINKIIKNDITKENNNKDVVKKENLESQDGKVSLNIFLEKMLIISSELSNGINQLNKKFDDKMDILEKRILNIENKLNIPNKELEQKEVINLVEVKSEILNIDKKEILKALKYNDYRSLIYIFKLYYKNNKNDKYVYPIKIIGTRSFEYYFDGKWHKDLYGNHIISVICGNIQTLFLKCNNLDDKDNISFEDFILNQDFIHKLSDEKYKKDIFKHIIEEVRINNKA